MEDLEKISENKLTFIMKVNGDSVSVRVNYHKGK